MTLLPSNMSFHFLLIKFDLASQALTTTSLYLHCQKSWKTNVRSPYPLFTHLIKQSSISVAGPTSLLKTIRNLIHTWFESTFLNSHCFSNINHYNPCSHLLSSHLPPHKQAKASKHLDLLNSLLYSASQFSIILIFPVFQLEISIFKIFAITSMSCHPNSNPKSLKVSLLNA